MSKKNTNSNSSRQAAQVATLNPETITAPVETAPVAAQEQTETTPAEFPHMDNFPTLAEGLKFEVNGYKVTVTGRNYIKASDAVKYPYTAWDATVTTPDGTTKDFQKVRNTAVMNFCKASTGITHNGGGTITKVLTDEEIATEAGRRAAQIAGLLNRANELAAKYGTSTADDEPTRHAAIIAQLTEDNNARKEQADKAKAENAKRQERKETRDLQKEIAELIAAGNFAKAAELMQQKADSQTAKETPENSDEIAK